MKLVDSNVWLALALSGHEHHTTASDWLAGQSAAGGVLFCRSTQLALVRLLTTKAVLAYYGAAPLTNLEAWGLYENLLADPRIGFSDEPPGLEERWKRFAATKMSSPKLWMDSYLAAFAAAGGHQLITIDSAFRQFHGLDVILLPKA